MSYGGSYTSAGMAAAPLVLVNPLFALAPVAGVLADWWYGPVTPVLPTAATPDERLRQAAEIEAALAKYNADPTLTPGSSLKWFAGITLVTAGVAAAVVLSRRAPRKKRRGRR